MSRCVESTVNLDNDMGRAYFFFGFKLFPADVTDTLPVTDVHTFERNTGSGTLLACQTAKEMFYRTWCSEFYKKSIPAISSIKACLRPAFGTWIVLPKFVINLDGVFELVFNHLLKLQPSYTFCFFSYSLYCSDLAKSR